jgi:hypothetical protein
MDEYNCRQCGSQQPKCQVDGSVGRNPRVERNTIFSVLVFSANELEPPVTIFLQPGRKEAGCEPLAPFALHCHTTPYRHNCERNIRASKWHENEGFVPEQRAVMTLERIEEIAVPVIQQVLYCKLRKCDRD